MESPVPFDISKLLQPPKKWTPRHLEGLNVQEQHHLPAAAIVGHAHLPTDTDPLFVELAEHFAKPTRNDILAGHYFPDNKFEGPLGWLTSAQDTFEAGYPPYITLLSIARIFWLHISSHDKIRYTSFSIPFHLSSLGVKGSLRSDIAYFMRTDKGSTLPLTIFIAGKGPEQQSITHEVVPFLLVQAILAHEQNSALENYTAFVVSMKGPTVQFVKGNFSRSYILDLINRKIPNSPLELGFSHPYDLLEQEDRKEFMRTFVGLFRCLYDLLEKYTVCNR